MKKVSIIICSIVIALVPAVARAVDAPLLLTDDQVEHIRNNCADTQTALRSLAATDKLSRINLGQQYESIATRLMAPMNSRVALNKLDGVELTRLTVEYNNELDNFRKTVYPDYSQALSATTDIKCYDQPIEFYDTLTIALQKRTQVKAVVDRLDKLLQQYRAAVVTVETNAMKGAGS